MPKNLKKESAFFEKIRGFWLYMKIDIEIAHFCKKIACYFTKFGHFNKEKLLTAKMEV